jgi:hypothetical protein
LIYAWDNSKRKKLFKSEKFPNTITNLAFNPTGKVLAIASANIYDNLDFPEEDCEIMDSTNTTSNSPKIYIQNFSSFL